MSTREDRQSRERKQAEVGRWHNLKSPRSDPWHRLSALQPCGLKGQRILLEYNADFSQTLTNGERYYFMYDDRWRIIGTFRDRDSSAKERFMYHNAGRVAARVVSVKLHI